MFIFSKFLSFIFSLGKFGPTKSEVCQIKWNLLQGYIVYGYFDFNVYFFKILFIHIFFWQVWSQNVKFFKLTEMLYFDVYFFKILIIHIFGLIWSHKLKFSILTEIWCSIASLYAWYDFNVDFNFKTFCHSHSFWQSWSQSCSPN